jgi:prepilin-type N-terminal cleavage/methylation domain-containing protein
MNKGFTLIELLATIIIILGILITIANIFGGVLR